jgi:hypothetical protein
LKIGDELIFLPNVIKDVSNPECEQFISTWMNNVVGLPNQLLKPAVIKLIKILLD